MSQDDSSTMQQDSHLFEPLSRPAHQPGMMLGVEAVRNEQAYNRRRLNRHQYWLHGSGTVVGLAVTLSSQTADPDDTQDQLIKLIVSPGIALDGFGREVVLHEPYCLDLQAWIESNRDQETREWNMESTHVPVNGGLWLDISIRQKDCDSGLQPVIAHEVNSTIDPVATANIEQGVWLDIKPITPADTAADALTLAGEPEAPLPGAIHPGATPNLEELLTTTENDYLNNLSGVPEQFARLHAERLFRLQHSELDPDFLTSDLEQLASVQLARIRLTTLDDTKLVSHPSRVAINNLIRPFVTNPDMVGWVLHKHHSES
jgi:hypothetical protein